jgi:hypothetical protein
MDDDCGPRCETRAKKCGQISGHRYPKGSNIAVMSEQRRYDDSLLAQSQICIFLKKIEETSPKLDCANLREYASENKHRTYQLQGDVGLE